jgi:uncharacterized SAM-dependent methyltransferase
MRLRAVKPFRWAGNHVEPGSLLVVGVDVSEAEARLILAYGDAVIVPDEESVPVIRHADPIVEHRDPIAGANTAPKRRRS